jgi:hypothetical protein
MMDWRRGVWRLWLIASALWALFLGYALVDELVSRPWNLRPASHTEAAVRFVVLLVVPPVTAVALAHAVGRVAQAFRKDAA